MTLAFADCRMDLSMMV